MKSNQDQPTQLKSKNQTSGTSTKNLIRQSGSEVQIGNYSETEANINHTINCKSAKAARQLALELSGTKFSSDDRRENTYKKLRSHPWYGLVVLSPDLTEDDKHFIAIFIQDNRTLSDQDFKLKVHHLFIYDSERPASYALIQEVLSVVARGNL